MFNRLQLSIENIKEKFNIQYNENPFILPEWKKSNEFESFIDELKTYPELEIFNEKIQYAISSSGKVTYEELAEWLIKKSQIYSSEKILINLKEYILQETYTAQIVILVSGISVIEKHNIDGNLEIFNPSFIDDFDLNLSFSHLDFNVIPTPNIGAIIKCDIKVPKRHTDVHINIKEEMPYLQITNEMIQPLEDLRLLISLLGNKRSPQSFCSGIITPSYIPILNNSYNWGIGEYKTTLPNPDIIKRDIDKIRIFYKKFSQLPDNLKKQLRVVLRFLSNAESTNDYVSNLINLRICLESLFLSDNVQNELKYRLSLRCSMLCNEETEKEEIFAKIKKIYDYSSTAIHTGTLKETKLKEIKEYHDFALIIIRKGMAYILENGEVDWFKSDLNGKISFK